MSTHQEAEPSAAAPEPSAASTSSPAPAPVASPASEPPLTPCPSFRVSPGLCAKLRELKLDLYPYTTVGRNLLFCGPVKIEPECTLLRVKIDAYSLVGRDSNVTTSSVGRYCSIGHDAEIGVGNHDTSGLTSSNAFQINTPFSFYTGVTPQRLNPTQRRLGEDTSENTIGHDVWIGAHCTITGNVTIGTGAVIGAGSVINHDVPPYAVVAGKGGGPNSKHIIKRYRFSDEVIADLLSSEWWQYDLPKVQTMYKERTGKALPLNKPQEFLAMLKGEDVASWPRIEEKWLYLCLSYSNNAKLLQVSPDIPLGHLYPEAMRQSPAWL